MTINKTFIVSGAGSGIGRATALSLANDMAGSSIILLGRRHAPLEETRAMLPNPSQHISLSVNITEPKALRSAFREIQLENRNVVGVIANAGVGGGNHYGEEDRWHEIIATNLSGVYYLVNETLSALRTSKSEYKHIVITSSVLARLGVPKYSAYCASKAGVLGLMRSLAAELASEKILVNAICPGWVETEMAEQGIKAMSERLSIDYAKAKAAQMSMVPLRKMAEPKELGNLVSFLVSGKQNSITGQCIDINNGALMP